MEPMHLFIINPNAGKKNRSEEIYKNIKALSIENAEIAVTRTPEDAKRTIQNACETHKKVRVYSCGGDGTLNEVIKSAHTYTHCAVGVIPLGSGNDFVKSFEEYSISDFRDIKKMVLGKTKKIDLMKVGNLPSINIISAGYDAAVGEHMNKFRRLPFVSGSMAYNLSLVYCLIHQRKHRFQLIADDVVIHDPSNNYIFAIAANGRFYGGGFKAAPYAKLSDGQIDFIRIPAVSIPTFLKFVGFFKQGKYLEKMPIAKLEHCKKLQIRADKPVKLNLDGEIVSIIDPIIEILPQAIDIILPEKQ